MNPILALLTLLFFGLIYLGFDIWAFPLISPDEPRYAETAREMLENGDWIVPYCDYSFRFHKPVLFYWLEAISFKAFGLNEFAARLPSVLSGLGLTWLAYLIGNLHGFGITAALITLSSLEVFIVSKLSITDMSLCFFISAAIAFFYIGYVKISFNRQKFAFKDRISSLWFTSSMVMMALGVLCKGPVAIVIPVATITLFLFLKRDLKEFFSNTWTELLKGFILFLLIVLPWYIAVHIQTDGAFTKEFFLSHNIDRFTKVHSGHDAPIWYYIPVVAIGFIPWIFFLIQSIFSFDYSSNINVNSEKAKKAQTHIFCLIWSIMVFGFFTIAQTKLPTYIVFIYLPLSIIVARWWQEKYKTVRGQTLKNTDALAGLLVYLFIAIAATISALTIVKPYLSPIGITVPVVIIGFLLISSILIAMTAILDRARIAFAFIFLGIALSSLLGTHLIFKKYAEIRDDGSKAFMRNLDKEVPFAVYRSYPTRFEFYGQRKVENLGHKKFINFLQESNGQAMFATKSKNFKKLEKFLDKHPEYNLSLENIIEVIKKGNIFSFGKAKSVIAKSHDVALAKSGNEEIHTSEK